MAAEYSRVQVTAARAMASRPAARQRARPRRADEVPAGRCASMIASAAVGVVPPQQAGIAAGIALLGRCSPTT